MPGRLDRVVLAQCDTPGNSSLRSIKLQYHGIYMVLATCGHGRLCSELCHRTVGLCFEPDSQVILVDVNFIKSSATFTADTTGKL